MSVKSPAAFVTTLLTPALVLGFTLSVVVNAFLLATRVNVLPSASSSSSAPAVAIAEQLPPIGFGDLKTGFRPNRQGVNALPAGQYRYQFADDLLPQLSGVLPVYRDPGVVTDTSAFLHVLDSMQIPLDNAALGLLPQAASFLSRDGKFRVDIDMANRTVKILRTVASPSPAPVEPLSDEQILAIAHEFALTLGIDSGKYGDQHIVNTGRTTDPHSKKILALGSEEVRWPLKFGAYPVVNEAGNPVFVLSITVDHQSAQAQALTMTLFSPDVLSRAEYPVADSTAMKTLALTGGLLPLPIDLKPKVKTVVVKYNAADLAYLLPAYDAATPTYIAPVLLLSGTLPCAQKGCVSAQWRTYVPALDPAHFAWKQ